MSLAISSCMRGAWLCHPSLSRITISSISSQEKLPVWVQLTIRIQVLTAWPFLIQDEKENPSTVPAKTIVLSVAFAMGAASSYVVCVRGSSLVRDKTSIR